MIPIFGYNVTVYLDSLVLLCGTDMTFTQRNTQVDVAGGSGAGTGIWTYNRFNTKYWEVEVRGATKADATDGPQDYFDVVAAPYATDFHDLFITFIDQDGNQASLGGKVVIPESELSGIVEDIAEGTIKLQGTGPLAINGIGGSSAVSCIPIAADGGFSGALPNATLNTPYSFTLPLTGTGPYTLGTISGAPGWMTIDVSSGSLVLGGTPTTFGDVGTVFLDITIDNPCGSIRLIDEVGFQVLEDGRNVFVINNSTHTITLSNTEGHNYTFLPSNASDGNITMPTDTLNIGTVDGGNIVNVNYEFLQDLVAGGTLINGGVCTGIMSIVTSDLSITNYLRFSNV